MQKACLQNEGGLSPGLLRSPRGFTSPCQAGECCEISGEHQALLSSSVRSPHIPVPYPLYLPPALTAAPAPPSEPGLGKYSPCCLHTCSDFVQFVIYFLWYCSLGIMLTCASQDWSKPQAGQALVPCFSSIGQGFLTPQLQGPCASRRCLDDVPAHLLKALGMNYLGYSKRDCSKAEDSIFPCPPERGCFERLSFNPHADCKSFLLKLTVNKQEKMLREALRGNGLCIAMLCASFIYIYISPNALYLLNALWGEERTS